MQETTLDGVERVSALDMNVLVVGAGVGGLMAALECWRKGCNVVVIERAADISPLGDFFTIPPSGLSTLAFYPTMYADYHKEVFDCSVSIWTPQGQCVYKAKPEWAAHQSKSAAPDVAISFLKRRPVFTKMLYEQCVRLGIPVTFSQEAQEIQENEREVIVTAKGGADYHADVCIMADGIGSRLSASIGTEMPVLDSGYAIARAAFPTDSIPRDSPAFSLVANVKHEPEFRTYLSEDLHLILFLTDNHVAFAYTHKNDGNAVESWHNLKDASIYVKQLEEKAKGWDPGVVDFFKHIPGSVVDWGLRWRDPSEQWTSKGGRAIKIGDSAHAFLPTAGNGAVQALETAITVAECLRMGGKENARWSTKVANKLRFQRTAVLQQVGFINREELHHADLVSIAKNESSDAVGFFKQGGWVWQHRPETYATQNYEQCLAHLKNGEAFVNTNLPPGHVFHKWTMEGENERIAARLPSDLKKNGYWVLNAKALGDDLAADFTRWIGSEKLEIITHYEEHESMQNRYSRAKGDVVVDHKHALT